MNWKSLHTINIPAGSDRPAQRIIHPTEPATATAPSNPEEHQHHHQPAPQANTQKPKKHTRSQQFRINGANSKGPTTPAGLNKCSKSALKHGLTAKTHTLLDIEDPAELDLHIQIALDHFRPTSLFTRQLVEELAKTSWRKNRLTLLETAYFNHQIAEGTTTDPLTQAATEGTGEIAALLRTWLASSGASGPIELLRRYIATLNTQFNTTLNNLLKLEKRDAQRRHDPNFEIPYIAPEYPTVTSKATELEDNDKNPETKRSQEEPVAKPPTIAQQPHNRQIPAEECA